MLDVQDVTKRFGGLTAVNHVSFAVQPGEILGYLGPNGSGKSTTVKMLTGLLRPTSGSIRFNGRDIDEDLVAYKQMVGYVPEEAHLYTYMSGSEYLRFTGRIRGLEERILEEKIERLLTVFGLAADPHAPLTAYSKGMRQKVLLSAALLHNPRMIVLDEPVSGLDAGTALVVRRIVEALAADGRIIFYSSHELDTIERISSRVIILSQGRVIADGSASELRALTQTASLEGVFSQLAIAEDLGAMAAEVIATMRL